LVKTSSASSAATFSASAVLMNWFRLTHRHGPDRARHPRQPDHAASGAVPHPLAEPVKMARRVALCLGEVGGPGRDQPLDEQAMAAVVDSTLHRQRRALANTA
jgi:hypothetical protein